MHNIIEIRFKKNMITFYTIYQDIAQQNHSTFNV